MAFNLHNSVIGGRIGALLHKSRNNWLSHDEILTIYGEKANPHLPTSTAIPPPLTRGFFFVDENQYIDLNDWIDVQQPRRRNCVSRVMPDGNLVRYTLARREYPGGGVFFRRTHHSCADHGDLALVHYLLVGGEPIEDETTDEEEDPDQDPNFVVQEDIIAIHPENALDSEDETDDEEDDYLGDPDYHPKKDCEVSMERNGKGVSIAGIHMFYGKIGDPDYHPKKDCEVSIESNGKGVSIAGIHRFYDKIGYEFLAPGIECVIDGCVTFFKQAIQKYFVEFNKTAEAFSQQEFSSTRLVKHNIDLIKLKFSGKPPEKCHLICVALVSRKSNGRGFMHSFSDHVLACIQVQIGHLDNGAPSMIDVCATFEVVFNKTGESCISISQQEFASKCLVKDDIVLTVFLQPEFGAPHLLFLHRL